MKPLATGSAFILLHDESRDWLYIEWDGRQSFDSIFAACSVLLEQVHHTRCPRIFCDASRDQDGWSRLVGWISHHYFQELASAGVEAVAWVLPVNLRARVDVERVVSAISFPVTDVFTDIEEAYAWLSRLPGNGSEAP